MFERQEGWVQARVYVRPPVAVSKLNSLATKSSFVGNFCSEHAARYNSFAT